MWKQFINKLHQRSSKHKNVSDFTQNHSDSNATNSRNSIERTISNGSAVSGRGVATVKRMSSAIFPSSVVTGIEPLLSFKDVPNHEKPNLFISKLNLCRVVFDFSNPNKNSIEKDLKSQALADLADYVTSATTRFTEPMIAASCKMFAANLFRVFPPNYRSNSSGGGENEEEEPMFDPAWSHLQGVYDLFLKIITSSAFDMKIGKKYIDHSFILRLLELFDSEDPRERDCLKTILHRIYGKFMVLRPFIRKSVSNIFYSFVFETYKHNGVAELLEVFGSVVSGFALPLKEEHKMFLWRVLIPLHKPRMVGSYIQQLTYCLIQFIEKEPKLASTVIKGLLKYWPVTNSQKEAIFLGELEEILEATNVVEFQKCMVFFFRRIGYCLNSSHFQVAERALFLWNNDHIVSLVAQNRQVIIPLISPALERNIRSHWNQVVLNVTLNVRKMLSEMDEELFLACHVKYEQDEEEAKALHEKRRMAWQHLETAAACQPVTGNTPVLVKPVAVPLIAAALS